MERKIKYVATLPDGQMVKRTSTHEYGWVVACKEADGKWRERGWRASEKAAQCRGRTEMKDGKYAEFQIVRARRSW